MAGSVFDNVISSRTPRTQGFPLSSTSLTRLVSKNYMNFISHESRSIQSLKMQNRTCLIKNQQTKSRFQNLESIMSNLSSLTATWFGPEPLNLLEDKIQNTYPYFRCLLVWNYFLPYMSLKQVARK